MIERFETERGQFLYSIQWKLFGMVHNLRKIASYGRRFAMGAG